MHLPLTLLVATALLVRVGSERCAIPSAGVCAKSTMSVSSSVQQMGDRSVHKSR